MISVDMPDLNFGKWQCWEERDRPPQPGIYAIALTDKSLAGQELDWKDVDYVGVTLNKGGLNARLDQFIATLRGPHKLHSGASTVRFKADWDDSGPVGGKQLYVALAPIPCELKDPDAEAFRTMGKILYLEFEAFARYIEACAEEPREDGLPKYNKKGQFKRGSGSSTG